jgi:hypothetical protein
LDKHVKEHAMNTKFGLLSLGLLALSACATPPSQSQLAGLPVVEFGQAVPRSGDFILHFPAGKDIPTDVAISGDIFQQPAQQVLTVKLKRDIYSYKQWMSYDKQHWLDGRDALGVKLDIKIPGYTYPKPGHIKLDLFEKKKAQ